VAANRRELGGSGSAGTGSARRVGGGRRCQGRGGGPRSPGRGGDRDGRGEPISPVCPRSGGCLRGALLAAPRAGRAATAAASLRSGWSGHRRRAGAARFRTPGGRADRPGKPTGEAGAICRTANLRLPVDVRVSRLGSLPPARRQQPCLALELGSFRSGGGRGRRGGPRGDRFSGVARRGRPARWMGRWPEAASAVPGSDHCRSPLVARRWCRLGDGFPPSLEELPRTRGLALPGAAERGREEGAGRGAGGRLCPTRPTAGSPPRSRRARGSGSRPRGLEPFALGGRGPALGSGRRVGGRPHFGVLLRFGGERGGSQPGTRRRRDPPSGVRVFGG